MTDIVEIEKALEKLHILAKECCYYDDYYYPIRFKASEQIKKHALLILKKLEKRAYNNGYSAGYEQGHEDEGLKIEGEINARKSYGN